MRLFWGILIVLILIAPVYAENVSVNDFISKHLFPGERFTKTKVGFFGMDFYIVYVAGTEKFIVDASAMVLAKDRGQIEEVLRAHFAATVNVADEVKNIPALVSSFNASRQPEESTCKRYTGTDRFPCNDKLSCLFSCRSVPLCLNIVNDRLVMAIVNWSIDDAALNSALAALLEKVPLIQGSGDEIVAPVESAYDAAKTAENATSRIKKNDLFVALSFCYPIKFNSSALNGIVANAKNARDKVLLLKNVDARADALFAEAPRREALASEKAIEERYSLMVANLSAKIDDIRAQMNYVLSKVNDNEIGQKFDALVAVGDEIEEIGGEKNYGAAFLKWSEFEDKAGNLTRLMDRRLSEYIALVALKENASAKLDELKALAGANGALAASVDNMTARLNAISARITAPLAPSSISALASELEAWKSDADRLARGGTNETRENQTVGQKGAVSSFCASLAIVGAALVLCIRAIAGNRK